MVRITAPTVRLAALTAILGLALPAGGAPARAQSGAGGAGSVPGQQLSQPQLPVAAPETAGKLFGDWGGVRTRLLNVGINLRLDYTAEIAGNVSGQKTGFDYAHQIGLGLDIDWDKLAGVPGFSTHFAGVNRAGRNISSDYLGDHLTQSQEIYGAGFDAALHLVNLYGEEKLFGDRLNIAVGRMPMGEDFGTSLLACIPIALTSECGIPRAIANSTAGTTWPNSGWAGRVRVRPTAETYVQVGLFDVRPFPAGGRSGWNWTTSHDTGFAVPVELGWEPVFGPDRMPGHYKVGYVHDTSDYPDLYTNDLGQPIAFSVAPGQTRHGRDGIWIMADQMIHRNGPAQDQGLILFASYAHSSADTSVTSDTAFAAVIDKGFWEARPDDVISLSFSWFGVSGQLNKLQQLDLDTGLPLANGAVTPQTNEYILEANYTFPVYRGVTLEPAIQYFINPNADRRVANAVVFAGRMHVDF